MGLPQLRRIAACKICATGSVFMAVNKIMHGDNSGSDGKKAEKMCRWMAKSHGNELRMTMDPTAHSATQLPLATFPLLTKVLQPRAKNESG